MAEDQNDEQELLTAAQIAAADDVEFKTIPTWVINGKQGYSRIRSLSAEDFIVWQEANEGTAKRNAGLRIIIKSLVDKEGNPVGDDKMLEMLKKKSHRVTDNIIAEILKLNGLKIKGEETKEKNV